MAAQVDTQTQTRGTAQRGRRMNRGRGGNRGGRGGKIAKGQAEGPASPEAKEPEVVQEEGKEEAKANDQAENASGDVDDAVCWICAEPVKYYALSECGHRTCHVCALRLRALYKKTECTFCKEPQNTMVFTMSPDAPWSSYDLSDMPYKDAKLNISFEAQEMMEDSLVLLRFNCPDPQCDYIGNGWSDLKLHTRGTHGKVMCDLCIRFKKIFAHEHVLYNPGQLPIHLPSLQRGNRQSGKKDKIEGGVHPLCEFCRECLFSEDEMFKHMREKHEECFICKRNEVRDQYFRNWEALEQHFQQAHYPCTYASCQAQKFVVFGSALDLKAHMVEVHGSDMSSRDMKDARRIQADFEFEEVSAGGRRGRHDRGDREREREPPPHVGSSRANTAGARRREAFGGNLTTESGPGVPNDGVNHSVSRRQSPSPDMDPALAERYSALFARVSSVAPNPNGAIPAVKAAIRSYRANESAARDLISTIWNISDNNLEGTAGVINALVEFIEEEDKKKDLLQAWNGFKIEQRNQFPELVPSESGSQWAGITSGRLLNAKQSTASRSRAQSSVQVLDRVARAAASSSTRLVPGSGRPAASAPASAAPAFPPLGFPPLAPGASAVSALAPKGQGQRNTPWAGSSAAAAAASSSGASVIRGPTSVPGPAARSGKAPPPPNLSKAAFPELPSASAARVPKAAVGGNKSLQNILGTSTPSTPVWEKAPVNSSGTGPSPETAASESAQENGNTGKGKKGKGKQKQTLFTLGSFPT
ncbi:uncharacterized protein PHACADRAFT_173202 [Phanerochaete carnosa HHB-10118-sp]|uniref:RING-type E3 ubiquitin transferase n=1 Tax=Phanerochaete carnosa (strain HHB-10118-sp) TaxID=650164 RepID=K5VUC1_PHACS|nr:uncharacterized protein PHACADRAFT_173202 [Phanerochaete carnosa HHB-10118-sp]EKM55123.1 hypothetical protein PHACADRAFT_173202 [Phanerochaete carnosa HHB-10118-sp]